MKKRRLDLLVIERGLAETREQARVAIMAGDVLVNGAAVVHAAVSVATDARIELAQAAKYASRGGDKLEHALRAFGVDVKGLVALDAGASTGGFTDCLLKHGASRVYAVDGGYGQLDYRLRQDARVVSMERTHIKDVASLPKRPEIATIDVSFIGLENVLPSVQRLLRPGGRIVALIKPQFQAKRSEVRKGGVVRDPQVHAKVIGRVVALAGRQGLRFGGLTASPLRGPAGNREFFILWTTPR
jgi:23S rRNA (cytidine1920-2'-O)/16S rRNA (cytidine1409-2'-O)-methyltransferase